MKRSFMMKIPLFLTIWLCAFPAAAFACSCVGGDRTPREEVTSVDAVFRGKVSNISKQGFGKAVTFDVERTWKGRNVPQLIVVTGSGGGDCGTPYSLGEEWLVYAYYEGGNLISFLSSNRRLSTHSCYTPRTTPVKYAQEDLQDLGMGKIPSPIEWYESKATMWIGILLLLSAIATGRFIRLKRQHDDVELDWRRR